MATEDFKAQLKTCSECLQTKQISDFYKQNEARDGLTRSCKRCVIERSLKWKAKNPEKVKAYAKKNSALPRNKSMRIANLKAKEKADPVYAMKARVRRFIRKAIRVGGHEKSMRAQQILGCSWSEFVLHIERQFAAGMTWKNKGEWHIDHIVPQSTAFTEDDVLALNHFTNLRPLWAKQNFAKGSARTHLL